MDRYLCIHGHFYQPPRENPWLEAIEAQDSAYPFHDWNERITEECYAPNATSRILDDEGRITDIVNNYAHISYNFGPTLLSWMKDNAPDTYRAIVDADRLSAERFGGHGSAMAQGYNHMILPLANDRDLRTQVAWGVEDFRFRFGRAPRGMWLPETAVDLRTLDMLAEYDVAFTILAPRQAGRVRAIGGKWPEKAEPIDPAMPYQVNLPSGRTIAVFFYDGPISQAVAFERLLNSGEGFAHRLATGFSAQREGPQLMHIATDGETYGHHHRFGDMALAYALHYIESNDIAQLTNYGQYLEMFPPTREVQVVENSSWSCVHGIGRWREHCGCHSGGRGDWTQAWRGPLREALDWLRDEIAAPFEREAGKLLKDPWAARDDYIHVILNRSPENRAAFLRRHGVAPISGDSEVRVWKLLELQRHAMLMYTSCGWFFDELSGIETVQVIQYAGRVIQLAEDLFDHSPEKGFLDLLEHAQSNITGYGNGRQVYERFVRPTRVDLLKVGAHYALASLFEDYPDEIEVYCYDVRREDMREHRAGRAQLEVGRIGLVSRVTREAANLSFAALHLGEHIMNAGVRRYTSDARYERLASAARTAFENADFTEVVRVMDSAFGAANYSLGSLFRDEQRRVADLVLESTLESIADNYRHIFENNAALVRYLHGLNIPVPRALQLPAEFVLNAEFRQVLDQDLPDVARLRELADEAQRQSVRLDEVGLGFAIGAALDRLAREALAHRRDETLFDVLRQLVELSRSLSMDVDLVDAQNAYWMLLQESRPEFARLAERGSESSRRWLEAFDRLGEALRIRAELSAQPPLVAT